MRFSESWLREWVNPDVGTDDLSHRLSMAGLEVESVEPAAPQGVGAQSSRSRMASLADEYIELDLTWLPGVMPTSRRGWRAPQLGTAADGSSS